jgi:hypothetical protein
LESAKDLDRVVNQEKYQVRVVNQEMIGAVRAAACRVLAADKCVNTFFTLVSNLEKI